VFHADHTIMGVRWGGTGTITIRLALEPAGSATRLTLGSEVDLPGLLKLVSPALQPVIGRQFEGELRTLKGLLEGGA
jgi:carbon monoxide dehydrogenase subunit G